MGLFNRQRTDGATYDGQGEERKGFIDLVSWNGEAEDLVWKYPYDNLSTATQVTVAESQEAIFFKDRAMYDVLGPGRHTLSTNNIPLLQKILNLPFGGNSPFKAEVVYINKVVKRAIPWGFGDLILEDKVYETQVKVLANGTFGIQIEDSTLFIKEMVGTQHLWTTDDVIDQFFSTLIRKVKRSISDYMIRQQVSILDINTLIDDISEYCLGAISGALAEYGLKIRAFDVAEINYDQNDPNVALIMQKKAEKRAAILDAEGRAAARKIEGTTYREERQLDVMETAAGNEGSANEFMGAGMGMGMGMGLGAMFGQQMHNIAGSVMGQQPYGQQPYGQQPYPQAGAVPPPMPQAVTFHVFINGTQAGPYDMNILSQMAQMGQLSRETLVWRAGMAQWAKAGDCPELAPLFAAPPMPPTPPTPPAPPTPPTM